MHSSPRDVFFNRDASPPEDEDFVSNDPMVRLTIDRQVPRNRRQGELLRGKHAELAFKDSVLDLPLDQAYCECILHRLGAAGDAAEHPLGNAPPRPEPLSEWRGHAHPHSQTPGPAQTPNLIFFNVLVALEWVPNDDYLRQLEWAFRRASDFLYDVTDGRMAFGQVTFANAEFMDCADIQIMASNRFHPRSWVAGFRDLEADATGDETKSKYLPVRLGRGLWQQRNLVSIPWDEPEAYRALIHEWAHYALGLTDRYLDKPRQLVRVREASEDDPRLVGAHEQLLVPPMKDDVPQYTVVVQSVSEPRESIMATLVGTSELVAHSAGASERHKEQEWGTIVEQFEHRIEQPARLLEGPGRLPLPLPQFHRRVGSRKPLAIPGETTKVLLTGSFVDIPVDRCRVYVMREPNTATGRPRLIAQGTLDARSTEEAFPLLGATEEDTVVLIADPPDRPPRVLSGPVSLIATGGAAERWSDVSPSTTPTITVLPRQAGALPQLAQIDVRVQSHDGPPPNQVWVFPLGQLDRAVELRSTRPNLWESETEAELTLDGYVLVNWGKWGEQLLITGFSQGGGPPSHGPFAPVPITAGSSDGDVMLFFHAGPEPQSLPLAEQEPHSQVKVVTTINTGATGRAPQNAVAWSYPFSLASNGPLPTKFNPTLIVQCRTPGERESLSGDLLICRLQNRAWEPQPTYLAPGAPFAATPLWVEGEEHPAGGALVDSKLAAEASRVEHYQLYWIPRRPQRR